MLGPPRDPCGAYRLAVCSRSKSVPPSDLAVTDPCQATYHRAMAHQKLAVVISARHACTSVVTGICQENPSIWRIIFRKRAHFFAGPIALFQIASCFGR
jgi:hypothetical protein